MSHTPLPLFAEHGEMDGASAPMMAPAQVPGMQAADAQPKLLHMKQSDLPMGGYTIGAIVDAEFASAWEPAAWKQWLAKDMKIKAKIAASMNYTSEHLHGALEAAIPKRYLDEYCGEGKNNTDIKVAVVWLPDGDAASIAKEIIVGTTTVSTYAHDSSTHRERDGSHRTHRRVECKIAVPSTAVKHTWDETRRGNERTPRDAQTTAWRARRRR